MLIVLGIMIVNPLNAKTDTTINVTSNNTLYDGDYFSISLSDINGTPIANQTVNITIIDANGGKNPQNVTTNEMGNGMLQLNGLTVGNYTINVTYGGNENYSACNITQKIEIKEKHVSTSAFHIILNLFMMVAHYVIRMALEEFTVQVVNFSLTKDNFINEH